MSWAFMTSDPDAIGDSARWTVAEMFEAYWPGRRADSIAEGARFDRGHFGGCRRSLVQQWQDQQR